MVENLSSKYKLALSLSCNANLGYHIQMILPRNSNAEIFDPPSEFIEVVMNNIIMQTIFLNNTCNTVGTKE